MGMCGTLRPKGSNIEAQRAESGAWDYWEGASCPPQQVGDLGEAV